MKLEGKIDGPWVSEFDRSWHVLATSLNSRPLVVDLREVSFIGTDGRRVLADLHKSTGAKFKTDSLLMEYYAKEASQKQTGKDGEK